MPQSWPSQWTILFTLFILSYVLVMILIYFSPNRWHSQKKEIFSKKACHLSWLW